MNEETIDKIICKLERAYLYAQVIFSWLVILFGYGYAARVLLTHYDRLFDKIFYTVCFAIIGFVGHKLMLRASLQELREDIKQDDHE